MSVLREKKLLLGITGGIAVYKACEVVRNLTDLGVEVQVAMTEAAQKFVTPLTFETLTGKPVLTNLFSTSEMVSTRHIEVPRTADRVLICPATANFLGKSANGLADDLLSVMVMVAGAKKTIYCPAMNSDMWANPAVQQNVARLKQQGALFIDPEFGQLACGTTGIGRLAAVERITARTKIELLRNQDFANKHILITAGPTEEALDPVRFITNASSGKMGFTLAEAALSQGARVTLVSGPTALVPPEEATVIKVRSASEMETAVLDCFTTTDVVIMAAAVSDYRPVDYSSTKIKKGGEHITVELQKNPDILARLGKQKKHQLLVGFAVETENIIANASQKLRDKNLDLIVANNPLVAGAGFQSDTNEVTLINRAGEEKQLALMSKFEVSLNILMEIAILLGIKPSPFKTTIHV